MHENSEGIFFYLSDRPKRKAQCIGFFLCRYGGDGHAIGLAMNLGHVQSTGHAFPNSDLSFRASVFQNWNVAIGVDG